MFQANQVKWPHPLSLAPPVSESAKEADWLEIEMDRKHSPPEFGKTDGEAVQGWNLSCKVVKKKKKKNINQCPGGVTGLFTPTGCRTAFSPRLKTVQATSWV